MDGLKISCPVDVSVSAKLMMGSEGCGGGVRVSSNNKADNNNCDKNARVNSSIDRCSVSISKKGAGSSSGASDSSLWRKLMHSHDFVHDRLTKLRVENPSETQNGYHLPIASPESADSTRKRGKLSRCSSSNGSSKRTKLILLDDTVNTSLRENETKEICGGQGSTLSDKPLVVKQRSSCHGKRVGDKRNSKLPTRTLSNINSTTGENAFFGAYGLKPAINDVTKQIEDLSLNKLLEGSYECPSLGKGKTKKSENSYETLLSVVKNVWSILPTRRALVHQSQSSAELDGCINRTIDSPSSISAAATQNDENSVLDGDISSSSSKEKMALNWRYHPCVIPSNPLNLPLCDASDVLKRIRLPLSKDLDSLLQDASKSSSQNSKNKNSDHQQQQPPRVGLPHFPWSQAFNGSSRTNSDSAKLLTGKTLCQGRWLRIATSPESSITDRFKNLDSLTFNQSLVPKQTKTVFGNSTSCQCTEAASTFVSPTGIKNLSSGNAEPEGSRDIVQNDVAALSCPQLLEAAQTLCDIAILKPANREDENNNNNPNGIFRWPKKLSQKSMKARKSKLIEKPPPLERHHHPTTTTTVSTTVSSFVLNNNHARKDSVTGEHNHHHHHHNHQQHHHFPKLSKRLKLSAMVENKKGSSSFPSSSSVSAIVSDRKHSSSSSKFKNHSRLMMPPPPLPPTRTLQKSSTYPQKSRKFPGHGLM